MLWIVAIVMALAAIAALTLMYMASYSCPPDPSFGPPSDIGCVPVTFWEVHMPLGNTDLPMAPVFVVFVLGGIVAGVGAIRARRHRNANVS